MLSIRNKICQLGCGGADLGNRKWYSSLKFGLPPRQESRVEWDKQIPSHHLIMGLITVRSCTKMC